MPRPSWLERALFVAAGFLVVIGLSELAGWWLNFKQAWPAYAPMRQI